MPIIIGEKKYSYVVLNIRESVLVAKKGNATINA